MPQITDDFNPIKAISTLRDNAVEIEKIGAEIEAARILGIQTMAALMDAEEAAREIVFQEEMKASFVRDYIKLKTAKEQKAHDIQREQIKILENKKDIIVEVNNSLKASFRIHDMEARNLNL